MPLPLPDSLVKLARNPYLAVGTPLILGMATGLITRTSIDTWYKDIKKPPYEPPRRAFPIAWSYLYATMGYASHLLAVSSAPLAPSALRLYYAQLGLNLVWTPTFFGLKRPGLALVDIIALTGTVFSLTNIARKVDRAAFYLLIPYCAWLVEATYLNAGTFWLNGGRELFFRGKRDVKGKAKAAEKEAKKDL